jgi:hypothetical protein
LVHGYAIHSATLVVAPLGLASLLAAMMSMDVLNQVLAVRQY